MISVIICTYNRDKYIYNVLKSITECDFPNNLYEIVVVNNNSTDSTELECNRFKADYPNINFRYFIELEQGLSNARNRGIMESRYEILVYVDDDAVVNKEYLQTVYAFLNTNPDVYSVGGPIIPIYETVEPKWISYFTKSLITGYKYEGDKIIEFKNGKYPGGGNAAYRKEVFEKTGLFNPELGRKGNNLIGSEEKDIFDKMRSLGMKFYYLPNMILYHFIPDSKLSLDYFNRLTFSIGQGERMRTLNISKTKYYERILLEIIKWVVSILLFVRYMILLSPQKGKKLIAFRLNVTKGLIASNTIHTLL